MFKLGYQTVSGLSSRMCFSSRIEQQAVSRKIARRYLSFSLDSSQRVVAGDAQRTLVVQTDLGEHLA